MSGASLVFALSDNFVFLVLAATIGVIAPTGGDVGSFLPVEQASLTHVVSDRDRTPAFGWYNVVGSIAGALGSLAGGLIVTFVEGVGFDELVGYRAVIGMSLVVGLVLAGIFLVVSPAVEVEVSAAPRGGRLGLHKSKGIVARLTALFAVDSFASGIIQMGLVIYWIHLRYGVEEAGLGFIWFWFQLFTGLSAVLSVWIARRIGLINTMVFTHIPASIMLMMIPFMPSLELTVGLVLVRALITQMDVPVRQSYTMAVVDPDERSATAGITNVIRSLAQSVGPGISTPLIVVPGLAVIPFLVGGALKVGYDLTLWKLFSSRPAPEEQARATAT
jgi:MFS family permease